MKGLPLLETHLHNPYNVLSLVLGDGHSVVNKIQHHILVWAGGERSK